MPRTKKPTTAAIQFKNLGKSLALAKKSHSNMAFGVFCKENRVFLTPIDYTGYEQHGVLIALKNEHGWGLYDFQLKQWLIPCQYQKLTVNESKTSAFCETKDGIQVFHAL